jgi:MoxR-like ATPase
MSYPFFTGKRVSPAKDGYSWLPASDRARECLPEHYDTEEGLVYAVNVALLMGQPLLVTGEPGTGKTQLAYRIAWELGFDPPLKFETKSESTARDLFYHFDTLTRFHAAQTESVFRKSTDFITYNALGTAIIRSHGPDDFEQKHLLPDDFDFGSCSRSVVLIDEIDKAPRDFPNDILNELEWLYFRVPEMGNAMIKAAPGMEPVVVITSNSEKDLPDAFLRRCAYYHIKFPEPDRLKRIVEGRLGDLATGHQAVVDDALAMFEQLRHSSVGLLKKPATAELLAWVTMLVRTKTTGNPFTDDRDTIRNSLGILIKSQEDLKAATQVVEKWFQKQTGSPSNGSPNN